MVETSTYRVELETFAGPMDLLLYLVRRDELDIRDLPIATITEQFFEFLTVLELIDLDMVGDFIVMASTLVEIKSRQVLPQQNDDETTEEDLADEPTSELIQKLLEYKRFKEAANSLEERAAEWMDRFPRLSSEHPGTSRNPAGDRIRDVELWDLVSAFGRVVKIKEVEQQHSVKYDETPIHVYVERIGAKIKAEKRVSFFGLFADQKIRSQVVGMFLAILELVRHHGFRAEQELDFNNIFLLPPEEGAEPTSPPPAASEFDEPATEDIDEPEAAATSNEGDPESEPATDNEPNSVDETTAEAESLADTEAGEDDI